MIGPSNPVISIGPILAVPGIREAIAASPAPVVAVSPYVAGKVVKGPTERFMAAVGRPSTAAGVASLYEGLIDGMVVDAGDPDPPPAGVPTLAAPTLMEGAEAPRAGSPRAVLDFADRAWWRVERHRDPPGEALRRRQAAASAGHRRRSGAARWSRRCSRTSSRRSAPRGSIERTIVVSGEPAPRRRSPRRPAPR